MLNKDPAWKRLRLTTLQQGCLGNSTAAQLSCAVIDISCLCSSTAYVSALSCCLYQSCTSEEQASKWQADPLVVPQSVLTTQLRSNSISRSARQLIEQRQTLLVVPLLASQALCRVQVQSKPRDRLSLRQPLQAQQPALPHPRAYPHSQEMLCRKPHHLKPRRNSPPSLQADH